MIQFNPNIIKLKAGQGDWYVLYQNGRVLIEGNNDYMFNIFKKITNYTNKEIKKLFDDSLTDFIEIKNVNLNKLKSLVNLTNLIENIIIKIKEENKNGFLK